MDRKLYRVEDPAGKHGLWRDFDGRFNPVFDKLSEGLARSLNMDDLPAVYKADGKSWFAAAPTKDTLKHWFSRKDVEELTALGYGVYEFTATDCRDISEFETVFTRESVKSVVELTIDDIWN